MKLFRSRNRNILFVRHGEYKGEFFVEVDRKDKCKDAGGEDVRVFLGLPDKDIHEVTDKDVVDGIKNKVLLIVDKLPREVYNVCLQEYKLLKSEKHKHGNNRRQSPLLQGV